MLLGLGNDSLHLFHSFNSPFSGTVLIHLYFCLALRTQFNVHIKFPDGHNLTFKFFTTAQNHIQKPVLLLPLPTRLGSKLSSPQCAR